MLNEGLKRAFFQVDSRNELEEMNFAINFGRNIFGGYLTDNICVIDCQKNYYFRGQHTACDEVDEVLHPLCFPLYH